MLPSLGGAAIGWYGLGEDGLPVVGPYPSLEELEAAILAAGHTLPADHFR
jgi:hypothetical protein